MSKPRPRIYFVRHGETDWNVAGRLQGQTDTPLNPKGHSQARAVALALMSIPERPSDLAFFVSPLLRARQTMDHIAQALSLAPQRVVIEPAVQELSFGVWEGKSFRDLRSSPDYPSHPEDRYHWRPERGESYADGDARMAEFLDRLDGPAVVVAHGAIGRCLIGSLTGMAKGDLVDLSMPQGFYCRLERGASEWFDAKADAA